jgi:hypothetical protein
VSQSGAPWGVVSGAVQSGAPWGVVSGAASHGVWCSGGRCAVVRGWRLAGPRVLILKQTLPGTETIDF